MKELKTEIILNASPESVWKVLTDFQKYPQWNPFIVKIEGELKLDSFLSTSLKSKDKLMSFRPKVTRLEEGRAFEWLGQAFLGTFKGRHYFVLEPLAEGKTKLIHGEQFSGLLSGMVLHMIGEETLHNFQRMNKALQAEVEKSFVS